MGEALPMLALVFSPALDISSWVLLIGGTTWPFLCESPQTEPICEGESPRAKLALEMFLVGLSPPADGLSGQLLLTKKQHLWGFYPGWERGW